MLPKSGRLKIEIKESSQGEPRTFIITLRDPAKVFQLTDLVRQRRSNKPLQSLFNQVIRDSLEECESAEKRFDSSPSSEQIPKLKQGASEVENHQPKRIVVRRLKVPTK